jgi:tRNA C32,U32 (ribose-2'-O)-methylase TrmJ
MRKRHFSSRRRRMIKPFLVRRSLDVEDALNLAVHRTEILGPALDARDLDEVIDLLQRARAVSANDHAAKPSLVSSLGLALRADPAVSAYVSYSGLRQRPG